MENLISKNFVKTMKGMKTTVRGRGTFPFMAPEFFAAKEGFGLTEGKFRIDASVDVFALGLVFAYVFGYSSGDFYGKRNCTKYLTVRLQAFTDFKDNYNVTIPLKRALIS